MPRSFLAPLLGLSIACVLIAVFLSLEVSHQPRFAQPEPGVLDLRTWVPGRDGAVRLSGAWVFADRHWRRQVRDTTPTTTGVVPGPWPATAPGSTLPRHDGFGTYRLRILLPRAATRRPLAIDTGQVLSAYRLYANGHLVAENGSASAESRSEVARSYSRLALLPDLGPELVLDLEVSNHLSRFGGVFAAPRLGLAQEIAGHRVLIEALSFILVGAMLFAAIYHFAAFAVSRTAFNLLAFALFAALMSTRTLLIEPLADYMVPLLGQNWVWRVDFAATMLILPAAYWFLCLTYRRQIARTIAPWVTGFCAGAAALTLVAGPIVGEFALKVFEVIALAALAYFTVGLARAAMAREGGSQIALIGWLISAATVLHDILIDLGILAGLNLIPFGFLAFLTCLSGSLLARFNSSLLSSEQRSRHLGALNEELEHLVDQRTAELKDAVEVLKRREIELERARSDAEAANVAKSRFLANMSHELRTPLNAILGFAELINRETYGPAGDHRYVEYAQVIVDSGTHLLSLIRDILDISKVEAGKYELHEEIVSVHELVTEAMRLVGAQSKSMHIELDVPGSLPPLLVDRRAVVQIIVNLLSNAIKFTPTDGRITVTGGLRADGGVFMAVTDTGLGMAAEDIPKALGVFTQVDDGLARKHEGSGLGLPIANALMGLHGGDLSIESAKGVGTTVRIDFPAARASVSKVA